VGDPDGSHILIALALGGSLLYFLWRRDLLTERDHKFGAAATTIDNYLSQACN
jgi:hypothetical protein